MLRSARRPAGLVLLLLLSLSRVGQSRPRAPGGDGPGRRAQLLEALRAGILSSLGVDREPRPNRAAPDQDLERMYQLYRDALREARGNASRRAGETWQFAVLHPATVELLHPHSAGRRQWYRAVFHKNADLLSELTLARAELQVSRQILDRPTSGRPRARQEVKVQINGRSPVQSNILTRANASSASDAMDVTPEVETWAAANGQTLVVDVGVLTDAGAPPPRPAISLEAGPGRSGPPRRPRRSSEEDECDERGWCCRKSLSVSFEEIGWTDWVVAPAEYTMHYCDGSCPHNYKPASMHAQVKARLQQAARGGAPGPCCVPAAYEPLVLMHYDSRGRLKLTPFDDMIVTKCNCA
ncbi:bone morphogenetic protein 2-A [Betta splendens]|uniref:Bone morphogenetic protein 2-A n=1 Tax=Betta splendens TaxID=158456 RepID=A0A6P7L5T3_BETSP|nr:bone morphogenetic protein 2-A [Betta splendens]